MPSCVYIMDKRKKKKTNKKNKLQELSIGNLRKTEMNCAQCQKQLFGLWKNESFQSCLECSNKKVDVLTMLKSMNRVCEVRVNSKIVDNTVIMRTLSNEDTEMEQSKDEENDYIGRNVEKNEKQCLRDSENKNISPDLKEGKIAQRTRRTRVNLRNHADQYIDNCKSNYVSNELIESINEDNLNSNNETYVTGTVENEDSETVSIIKTRRRSSLASTVLDEFPGNKVPVASESIQEDNMSKRPRKTAKLHTKLSVENMVSVQHGYNKRRQLPIEESTISKLAKGRKRGKESEKMEDDDSSSTGKISKNQPEVLSKNKVCDTKDKNINYVETRKRRQSSAFKEIISSEPPYEEINENRNLQKARRIHKDVSPEDKGCDNKNKKKAQPEESIQKETDSKSITEAKRLKIDMESYHISGIERIKRRSSRANLNTSPNSSGKNKNVVNGSVDSKRRTRASLNISDKAITDPDMLDDIQSSITQGVEHHSGHEKKQEEFIKESKIKTKKPQPKLVSVKLSTERKEKQQEIPIRQEEKKPLNAKQKPPIPARTLELLRSTRGMKPVVLVEKMITVKQKIARQSARNEKKGNSIGQKKKGTMFNFNKKNDTSSVKSLMAEQVENKHILVSEKSEKPIMKEASNIDSKVTCDQEQKPTTLRTLGKGQHNQSELFKLNGNHVENSGGKRKTKCVKKYQSLRLRNSEMKEKKPGTSDLGTKADKKMEQTPKSFLCEKCEKCFVNVLQLKSHELMHTGYFELKLERIDTKTIRKTEGEIISKEIINYILKSVFAKETDNVCEVYKEEVYDCADLHPNIPEEVCDATKNSQYELKNVQVMLKRIDLREAIATNKSNEGVIVASSIMNNILNNMNDNTGEQFIYAHGKPGNVDFDNHNKTVEVESFMSELEESVNDDHFSQECFGKAHSEGQEVGIVDTDPDCEQTDNQSHKMKHSEYCNKVDDSSEVISNNESELDKEESNDMFESDVTDNINNEDVKVHETNSAENWSHRSTDCDKNVLYNDKSAQRTDKNLDCNVLMNINKLDDGKTHLSSSISEIISNEGAETLPDTFIVSRTEFLEDADPVLTSKDSAEPGICKMNKEEIEYDQINDVQEVTSDVDTRICEYSGTVSSTKCEYNEKMVIETDEVNKDKEKAGNSKSTELQNTTNNEEICSYIVTNNMDKTDSGTLLEVSKGDDDDDDDDDDGDGDHDDDNDDDDDGIDNDNNNDDDGCGSGSDDGTSVKSKVDTSESQHSGDIAETNKSVSICNNDNNKTSGDISIEFSTYTDNNINETFSEGKKSTVSEQSESSDSDSGSDSDNMTCKNKESSPSKQNSHDDTDCLATKSENTGFDEPPKQEVQQTHESVHNTDYDTIGISTFTHVSANVENHYTECRQEIENTCSVETSFSDEQQILTLNNKSSDKSNVLVPQDTDTTIQHDLEMKHFNVLQDNNQSETNICKWRKEELNDFENPCSEFVSDIESKSSATVKVEDGSSDRTGSDGSESQIFVPVPDSMETTLHNASNNFMQVKSSESNNSEVNSENKRMSENTLENEAANESNYKSMEKYLESFIKDFIVRNTERTETNVESSIENKHENEEMEKLIVDVAPTKDTCTSNITSDYIITEKTSADDSTSTEGKCSSNSSSDYLTTEKTYNDSLQNMTGMLFNEICLSSDVERKSQKMNEKESFAQNSFSTTVTSENQIQLTSTEEINDCTTSAETSGDVYRLSGNKNETASPSSYVSDTGTVINCRLSVNDATKPDTQGQFCHKSETDFSTMRKHSISDTQRQSIDSNTQRQSSDMSNTQRQSSDMSSTQRQSSNMSSTQRQSSDMSITLRQSSDYMPRQSSDMSSTQRQSSDMSSMQRQLSDKLEPTLSSSGNHITYSIQKQSYDRREHDSGTSSIYTDNTRRYSGDRWQSESSSDSARRHSNDRREVDYSTAHIPVVGTSNTYQRSVMDNRRHYTESHESRPYADPRDNRGNSYGSNWRNPVQNRTHPYQHNTNKRNDRGSYSNWRWPGPNNYSHYRQSNNWR